MARINMPYREYREGADGKPSLHQSTHAPGQGGSSGAAINVLSQYPRGGKMAGKQSQMMSSPTNMLGAYVDRYMGNNFMSGQQAGRWRDTEMERLGIDAANQNAAYERGMGPSSYFQQQVDAAAAQFAADEREKKMYELQKQREQEQWNLQQSRNRDPNPSVYQVGPPDRGVGGINALQRYWRM